MMPLLARLAEHNRGVITAKAVMLFRPRFAAGVYCADAHMLNIELILF